MLTSIKKNGKGILLMGLSSLCVCLGQLFWKISTIENIGYLFGGFFLYGLGALIMLLAYRFGKLSILQPMLSLSYVLSIVLARIVLQEQITVVKCIGVILIILGVVLIAGGDED